MGVRRCGWCKAILGDAPEIPGDRETTGICAECATRVLLGARDPLTELDGLEARLANLEGIVAEIVRHHVVGS